MAANLPPLEARLKAFEAYRNSLPVETDKHKALETAAKLVEAALPLFSGFSTHTVKEGRICVEHLKQAVDNYAQKRQLCSTFSPHVDLFQRVEAVQKKALDSLLEKEKEIFDSFRQQTENLSVALRIDSTSSVSDLKASQSKVNEALAKLEKLYEDAHPSFQEQAAPILISIRSEAQEFLSHTEELIEAKLKKMMDTVD